MPRRGESWVCGPDPNIRRCGECRYFSCKSVWGSMYKPQCLLFGKYNLMSETSPACEKFERKQKRKISNE